MPTLTLVLGLTQLHAEASSLLAILPTAAAGVWRQREYGNVRWRRRSLLGLGGDRRRRGGCADRRVAARARAAAAVRGADARPSPPSWPGARGESRPMLPDVASVEEFWIPLVDEPIGSIVARDPGGAARDRRARRLAAPPARVPHLRLHPGRASCSAACSSSTTSSRTRAAPGPSSWRTAPSTASKVVREVLRGRRGGRGRPRVCGRARSGRATRSGSASRSSPSAAWPPTAEFSASRAAVSADNAWTVGKRLTILVALAGLARPARRGGRRRRRRLDRGRVGAARWRSAWSCPARPARRPASISSPPDHAAFGSGFAYPADGSVVSTGSISASASSDFGHLRRRRRDEPGAVAQPLRRRDHRRRRSRARRAARPAAALRGATSPARRSPALTVLGSAAAVAPNGRVALGDWGYLVTLEQGTDASSGAGGTQGFHGFVTALAVHLTAPHGEPAGRLGDPGRLRGGERAGQRRARARSRSRPARSRSSPSTRSGSRRPIAPEPTRNGRSLAAAAGDARPACSRS